MKYTLAVASLLAISEAELCESNYVGIPGDIKFTNLDDLREIDHSSFDVY